MPTHIIADYEITYEPNAEPALLIYHVVRGYDALTLNQPATDLLCALLAVQQKRIREIGGYRAIFGSGGDVVFYTPAGQRACYFNEAQSVLLARMLGVTTP
ncbi:hypothetical protein [Candidatus Chloroploca sp. Khr17]|uniref:hypothetical protein n=1 Tax=Candidatus Chloroploca sp. Khr17 TaxID=2496869 RepID=UPI00101B5E0B|nr:hypothetical protein [Candidatus Chloroploca sp. Khr17]